MTNYGQVNSTRGISFEINENEIIGLVGESGSGKSITAHTLLRLLPTYGKVTNGQIIYKGEKAWLSSYPTGKIRLKRMRMG